MIDIKNNIENIRYYFYDNVNLIKNEISECEPFHFYDRYLLELTAREFLDFIYILIDDVTESVFEKKNDTIDLINYMAGEELIVIDEIEGVYSLQESELTCMKDIQKRIDLLKEIHHIEKEKGMMLNNLSTTLFSIKDLKRL